VSTRPVWQLWETREQKAALEARNGLLLFSAIEEMVRNSAGGFALTPETLCTLHELVIRDLYICAGRFREHIDVAIGNSPHVPPNWTAVPQHVNEMCAYVNENFGKSAIHLAAYLMWKLNWIHPFAGGNGRTSRGVSYLVPNVRLGFWLPGKRTIPQQIEANRAPYYDALRAADFAAINGGMDVSRMEALVSDMLGAQLLSVHEQACADRQPNS
jgi:Fic family protein